MEIDSRTGYPVLRKTEYMSRTFGFDFAALLDGNTITSVNSVTATKQDLITGSSALTVGSGSASGTKVTTRLSAGTDGEDYLMDCRITDSGGNNLQAFGILRVRD